MTSYDYFAEVGAEELENQNEEEACCLEVRALFAAQRGLKSNKKACSEANAAMNAAIGKISRLQRENAALKAEIDDWKGNAEGFEPDAYMKLPLDADGVPIRIGDTVYAHDGSEFRVRSIIVNNAVCGVGVKLLEGPNLSTHMEPEVLSHRAPELSDSWEKLEEDAKMVKACDYAHAPRDEYGITVCRDCRFQKSKSCRQEMILDMIARAKRLAGIEEQEGK